MYSEGNDKSAFGWAVAWMADMLVGGENYADLGESKLDIGIVACITQWEFCSGTQSPYCSKSCRSSAQQTQCSSDETPSARSDETAKTKAKLYRQSFYADRFYTLRSNFLLFVQVFWQARENNFKLDFFLFFLHEWPSSERLNLNSVTYKQSASNLWGSKYL